MQHRIETSEIEVRLFLEAIRLKYGYDLTGYLGTSMQRRVFAALAKSGCSSLGHLQHRVLTEPAVFSRVLEDLTVRVTEMFRDPGFYRMFRASVVPILRTYPLLRLWHAGCSTGEEVYSMAILLREEGLYERSQIYATDLSPYALERAKNGVHSPKSLQTLKDRYEKAGGSSRLSDHCTEGYDSVALHQSLLRNVFFFHHNLVSDHVFGEMHVILCRNVLMYFGQELRENVIAKLGASLSAHGFLCLGSSERLTQIEPISRFTDFDAEQRIYRHQAVA